MIIYNILIGILILLLIYLVIFVIQNYNSSNPPSPVNPPLSPLEPVNPPTPIPVNPPRPTPVNPPRPVNPPAPVNPPGPINPPRPVNPPAPVNPPRPPTPPVLPSPTPTWTQDNIIELDSYLRNLFTNLFLLKTVQLREPIKDDTYKYIEEAIMNKYTYTEYKNVFLDFSKLEYIGQVTELGGYWLNKTYKPVPFPSDDNINLVVFILENLDKYQPLTKIYFENIFSYYTDIGNWGDKINEAADCVYDTGASKYNLTPITSMFFTTLYNNLNLCMGIYNDSYSKDVQDKSTQKLHDYFNNINGPMNDYCSTKIGD
jgi:hypothetical protein